MKFFKRVKVLVLVVILVLLGIFIYLNKAKVVSIFGNNQDKEAAYSPSLVSEPTRTTLLDFGSTKVDGIINSRNKTTINITLFATSDYCIKTIEFNSQTYSNEEKENWLTLNFDIDEVDFYDRFNIKLTMASGEVYESVLDLKYLKLPNTAPSTPTISSSAISTNIKLRTRLTLTASNSSDAENDSFSYVWEGRNAETSTYSAGPHTVRVKAVDEYGYSSDWATYSFNVANVTPPVLNYTKNNDRSFDLSYNGSSLMKDFMSIVFEPSDSALTMTLNLEHIYDDSHVKVSYIVNNPTLSNVSFRIGTVFKRLNTHGYGDVASVNFYDKGYIIYNTKNSSDYLYVYLNNTENVTNVTSYTSYSGYAWIWDTIYAYMWGNSRWSHSNDMNMYTAYSWQGQSIGPGQTKKYSVIFAME